MQLRTIRFNSKGVEHKITEVDSKVRSKKKKPDILSNFFSSEDFRNLYMVSLTRASSNTLYDSLTSVNQRLDECGIVIIGDKVVDVHKEGSSA